MAYSTSLSHGHAGPAAVPVAAQAHLRRITSIDALRGIVMVVMMLDHVRETFYLHLQVTDPMAVPGTSPEVFFSRLAAHFCAPIFVFLTGLGAWLYAHPPAGVPRPVAGYLVKRGLLLIALELTLVNFAWSGRYQVLYLQVMWAIGVCMLALALLHRWPRGMLLVLAAVLIAGHQPLAGLTVTRDSPWHALWTLMLHRGWLVEGGPLPVRVSYPALPWVGMILLGYLSGPLYAANVAPHRRQWALLAGGLGALLALLLLRGLNLYGENLPWSPGATPVLTLMSWLNLTKYPPSLSFTLLTLGVGVLLLAALEKTDNAATRALSAFGGAPMFYYLLHLYVLLVAYRLLLAVFGPNQGARFGVDADAFRLVWVVWIALVVALYPAVAAFARFKRRTAIGWVKYF